MDDKSDDTGKHGKPKKTWRSTSRRDLEEMGDAQSRDHSLPGSEHDPEKHLIFLDFNYKMLYYVLL